MLYSMKIRCDLLLNFQVPSHSELYGAKIRSYCNERSRLIRPTDKCFLRTPQSSDGLQPRDEGIHGEPSVPSYSMHMRAMQLVTDA